MKSCRPEYDVKRLLIILVLTVVFTTLFFWNRGHRPLEEGAPGTNQEVPTRGNDKRPTLTDEKRKNVKEAPSVSRSSGETPVKEKPQLPSQGVAPEQVRGIDFNSFSDVEKERITKEYKSHFKREFDPLEVVKGEIVGIVSLAYRRYEGKFKIQFKTPAVFNDGTKYIPIFMVGITNPATNMSGAAMREDTSTDSGSIVIHLVGFALMPFFSKDVGAATATQEHELNEISDIMFTVTPKRKRGTSDVIARFSFDIHEAPTTIGTFSYVVNN